MALRLIPQHDSLRAFHVEIDGEVLAIAYWDRSSGEWFLTADAARPTLPAPFQRWTYEFASLGDLCAFLSAPIPASPATLNLSEAA